MALGIKKDELSFEILVGTNPKTLLFLDTSTYKETPERPLLEITLPGFSKYNLVNIVAGEINVLNSSLVGLNKTLGHSKLQELPDGVYTLKYKICPYDLVYLQRYHLRTTKLEQQLHEVFHKADLCNCGDEERLKRDLTDILLLLEGGRSEAALGFSDRAHDCYQKAQSLLNKIIERLNVNC